MSEHNQHSVERQLIEWISDLSAKDQLITPNTNFVSSGLLDSFSVLGLIMQIEKFYGFKFDVAEIANTEMQVIKQLSALISTKLAIK